MVSLILLSDYSKKIEQVQVQAKIRIFISITFSSAPFMLNTCPGRKELADSLNILFDLHSYQFDFYEVIRFCSLLPVIRILVQYDLCVLLVPKASHMLRVAKQNIRPLP